MVVKKEIKDNTIMQLFNDLCSLRLENDDAKLNYL